MSNPVKCESVCATTPLHKTFSARAKVLETPELLDYILKEASLQACPLSKCEFYTYNVSKDTFGSRQSFICGNHHGRELYKNALVSRSWSSAALKRLWTFHTNPFALRSFFSNPTATHCIELSNVERWKTYSGFIRSFTIGDSPYRVKSTEEEGAHGSALMLLKINPLLQGQPLMPDLRYIRAHGWWLTTGCALPALITLLSTQTERLYLDFTGMFESLRNIPSCIAALTSLAPNLKLLRVNFQIDDTHLEDRQTTLQARVKSMSFILSPLLKRFVQLQTLQLPSMWEPYDALESLQGLPHLRLLDLFDTATPDQLFSTFCQEERTFCSVDNGDVLKFPSLQCLLLKGTNTSLADIFHAYFFPKHSLKALVIRVIKKLDDDYLCFHEVIKAIGNYFPQLQSLHIDTTSTSQASRSGWDQLKSLSPCSDLRRLDVTDCWLTNTDLLAISKAFTKLEELELKDGRALHRLCEDPNDDSIMYDTLEGITIDTLEIVALNLPNLSRLNITVVASDTQSLKFSSHAFQKLSYLQLSWSFINMHLEGFDKKNAAFFLSSLLPTECRFNIDSYLSCKCTLRRFFDSEKFFNTYSTFSNKFSEIVRDFVELRANERERLAHSCSLQEEHVCHSSNR